MHGFVWHLDLEGASTSNDATSEIERAGHARRWRSPDGSLTVDVLGDGGRASWHFEPEPGLGVVIDGTLYNRERLWSELGGAGKHDTAAALVLQAYLRWKEELLSRLDGDFAFVLFDARTREVFAATDPAGKRPLFHHHRKGKVLAFGTDLERLASRCGLDPRIPESRLLEPLFNSEVLVHYGPEVAGVERLMAARMCHVDAAGMRTTRYWAPGATRPALRANDIGGWIEGLRELMHAAVRKRLADGVRAGVQFSGGLDSSAVLALAGTMVPDDRVRAYAVVNRDDPGCPETRAIDHVLAQAGVASVVINVAHAREAAAQALTVAADAPRFVLGRNGFMLLFIAMANASGVGAIMNGYDADALFDESDYFERLLRAGKPARVLANARRQDRLAYEPWMLSKVRRMRLLGHLPGWLRTRLQQARRQWSEAAQLRAALLSDATVQALDLRTRLRAATELTRAPRPPDEPLPTDMFVHAWVHEGVARYADVFSRSGVDERCPFYDRALMDFAAWIPLELRLRNGHPKWLLRKAMAPYLPREVIWRGDKYHLGSHFDRVMLQPVLEQVVRDFRGSGPAVAAYVDRGRFLAEAKRWQAGAIEAVWNLKMLLLLENWLGRNADKVRWGS